MDDQRAELHLSAITALPDGTCKVTLSATEGPAPEQDEEYVCPITEGDFTVVSHDEAYGMRYGFHGDDRALSRAVLAFHHARSVIFGPPADGYPEGSRP